MPTGTTTEASFLTFVATQWAGFASRLPSPLGYCHEAVRISLVKNTGFPLIYPTFYIAQIRLVIGLHIILHTYPLRIKVPVTALA